MRATVKTVMLAQATLAAITAAVAWPLAGPLATAAALYGGITAIAVTAITAWRTTRITTNTAGMLHLYLAIAERYGIAIVLFVIAFALTPLPAAATVIGFAVAQLGGVGVGLVGRG